MNAFFAIFIAGAIGLATAQITTGRCGEEIVGRIIGGQNIQRCTWPYTPLVSIKIFYNADIGAASNFGNLTICGGAVINDQYILTSAICAAPLYGPQGAVVRQSTRIIVGDFDTRVTDVGNDGQPEDVIAVEDVKIHQFYNNLTTDNNVAIIKLASPIRANDCKQPACLLPQQNSRSTSRCDEVEVDSTCIMASVGLRLATAIDTPPIPQQAPIRMFSRPVTEAIVRAIPGNVLPEGAVLGQANDPSVQACLFDWGGIVVCRKSGRWWLRGLIGTNNCILSNNPDSRPAPIFITEVSYYRAWIDRCVANFNFCPSLPFF